MNRLYFPYPKNRVYLLTHDEFIDLIHVKNVINIYRLYNIDSSSDSRVDIIKELVTRCYHIDRQGNMLT